MAVAIRLTRIGATKRPAYRVIAIDKRRPRDGRALEILGFYDPLTEPATVNLETERINAWIGKGAQPSETVVKLMRQAEAAAKGEPAEKPKRATRTSKPSKKARAKAEAAAAAPAEPAPAAGAADAEAPAGEDEATVEAPLAEAESPATEPEAQAATEPEAEASTGEAPAAAGTSADDEDPAAGDAEKADA